MKENDSSSAKAFWSSTLSKLAPTMTAPAAANSEARSRSPLPSICQPGVEAFGYPHRTTQLPVRSPELTVRPSWSDAVNAGATVPASSMGRPPSWLASGGPLGTPEMTLMHKPALVRTDQASQETDCSSL